MRMSERGTLASVLGYMFIGSGNSPLAVASYSLLGTTASRLQTRRTKCYKYNAPRLDQLI